MKQKIFIKPESHSNTTLFRHSGVPDGFSSRPWQYYHNVQQLYVPLDFLRISISFFSSYDASSSN